MTDNIWVAGGRQRGLRPLTATLDWYEYEAGVIVDVDTRSGDGRQVVEYVSPPAVTPDEQATILFKSGTLVDDVLYLTTQTEVVLYRVPRFDVIEHISIPQFNDLHHVMPTSRGTLLVAATGLDMVLEIDHAGRILQEWDVTGNGLWRRFSRDVDYRKVPTTKPHEAHPNFVFTLGDEIWATRFERRDAISVSRPGRQIQIGLQRVHDGVVRNGRIHFTTVDGHLVLVDAETLATERVLDLADTRAPDSALGWTRGVHVVDDRHAWVGFSRIRPTKFRENIAFVARGFRRYMGTHVALYDTLTGACLERIDVEPFGLSAVFGIYPVVDPRAAGRPG